MCELYIFEISLSAAGTLMGMSNVLNLYNSGEHKSLGFPNNENGELEISNSCGTVFQNRLMIFGGLINRFQGID